MHPSPSSYRAHNRQFVIGPTVAKVYSDWKDCHLGNGYVLSHCPNLKVRQTRGKDGKDLTLLGHALQSDANRPSVDHCLANVGIVEMDVARPWIEEVYSWAGRWALVCGGHLVGDASNSLGLFYLIEDGELLISSSLAILNQLRPGRRMPQRRFNERGLNWNPPPHSALKGVNKLLPDQMLDLTAGEVHAVEKSRLSSLPTWSAQQAGKALLLSMQTVLRHLAEEFSRIHLTLTAGFDSRTLLASGRSTGVPMTAVTIDHPRISLADKLFPPQLCEVVGIPHHFVPIGKRSDRMATIYAEHTLMDVDEVDRFFLERGMFDWVDEGACVVRGTGFSVGRQAMHKVTSSLDWQQVTQNPRQLVRRFGDFACLETESNQMITWISWRNRTQAKWPDHYSWRERFYIDQRLGGWAAAGEQCLDLLPGVSINPANCSAVWDLLLQTNDVDQKNGAAQIECIRQAGLGLDAFPFNPILESRASRAMIRLQQVLDRMRIEGENLGRSLLK